MKNARTAAGRELIEELTKEFESICAQGDIIYLGTPQSADSIYNNLPSRGYEMRIWTGRYPTQEEMADYGAALAPMLLDDIKANPKLQSGYGLLGTQGAPTCPEMFDDETLISKELSQGASKFKLQFMLSTSLSDADRYPLKLSNFIVADYNHMSAPVHLVWSQDPDNRVKEFQKLGNKASDKLYWAVKKAYEYDKYSETIMYIDPAGGGMNDGDESVGIILSRMTNMLFLRDIVATAGGYNEVDLLKFVYACKEHKVTTVRIEKNYGNGAHRAMLQPLFDKHYPCFVEEETVTGQKEVRIIDTLEPVLGSHRLVIHPSIIEKDKQLTLRYPTEKQRVYSLLFQLSMITRDKRCLRHDDRVDALSGAVRYFLESIDFNEKVKEEKHHNEMANEFLNSWREKGKKSTGSYSTFVHKNILSKWK